ncbi:MAG: FKBP-type peptidyl-prolyl cis-trans isomerase [Halioglobus sp.]|nr:FKBP-type peptidyl-prolyl cis-trans isomerase [Halioglobus sp.]
MKKYLLLFTLASLVALQGCNQKTPAAAGDEAVPAADAAATPALDSDLATSDQRLSYGIAFGLGQRMKADGVPLDTGAFSAGLSDALAGSEPRLTEEEIAAEMQAYQEKAQVEMAAAQAEAGAANVASSAAFLAANATKEGVVVTDSGLQYEIITEGTGPMPGPDDQVEVHYRGTLVDGTVFDSSIDRGETVTFGVSQVIPGWTEALQLMPTGSTWLLAIPSELAYGAGGAGQVIGPDSALIFEVELIAIPSQAAEGSDAAEPAAEG